MVVILELMMCTFVYWKQEQTLLSFPFIITLPALSLLPAILVSTSLSETGKLAYVQVGSGSTLGVSLVNIHKKPLFFCKLILYLTAYFVLAHFIYMLPR